MRASRYVAGFDSSGAMLRALARFLHGRDFPALGNPRVLAPLLVAATCCRRGCGNASMRPAAG